MSQPDTHASTHPERGGQTLMSKIRNLAATKYLAVSLLMTVPAFTSCDKATINPAIEIINDVKFKEYIVEPQPGEIYFILPDGKKVIADGLVSFDVKENLTTGTRTIKFVFEGTKLKKTLTEALNEMKMSYPN